MSSLRLVLRRLLLLCVAGAAGFALGRVDTRAHAPQPSDYELFAPWYTAPAATESARWYPTVRLLDAKDQGGASLLPPTGYAWIPEGQSSWEVLAGASPKRYHASPVLLPDGLFLQGTAPGTDPSPPSPVTGR